MSVEIQSSPRQERIDKFHERTTERAQVLADLWARANTLGTPRLSDTAEQKSTEQSLLFGALDKLYEAHPGLREKHIRLKEIKAEEKFLQTEYQEEFEGEIIESEYYYSDPRVIALEKEAGSLFRDQDLAFADRVDQGIQGLIEKRDQVRGMQSLVGEPNGDGWIWSKAKANKVLDKSNRFKGSATRIFFGRFSANIFIDSEAFEADGKKYWAGFSVGVLNYIQESSREDRLLMNMFGKDPDILLMKTVRHEEFHSFADSFELGTNWGTLKNKYEARLKRFQRLNELKAPPLILGHELRMLREVVQLIGDASFEEILAEFAASDERLGIPKRTFRTLDSEKTAFFDRIIADQPELLEGLSLKFDVEKVRSQIEEIYTIVDSTIPQRRAEVDALFAMFPPSKYSLIRRVVQRWVDEKNTQDIKAMLTRFVDRTKSNGLDS